MTIIVKGRHPELGTEVAIKFLSPEFRRDARVIARFCEAAKSLARIQSEHVVRVLDVGSTLSLGPYVVVEHVEGRSLGAILREEGPFPESRAVKYALQVCKALSVAHACGVVHRNIKPESLFLAQRGEFEALRVLGFFEDDGGAVDNSSLSSLPSRPNQAPEVIRRDSNIDHRADIWSIGMTLHELIAGTTQLGMLPRRTGPHGSSPGFPPAPAPQQTLSTAVRTVIMRCLQGAPAHRYQSVDELAAALIPLTTMTEVFRGNLTGVFSRQMLAAALAQSQAAQSQAAQSPLKQQKWVSNSSSAWGSRIAASPALAMPIALCNWLFTTWREELFALPDAVFKRRHLIYIALVIALVSLIAIGFASDQ
jgi:serine/threonine protein kinase